MTKFPTLSMAIAAAALLGITAAGQQSSAARAPQPGIDWPAFRGIDEW